MLVDGLANDLRPLVQAKLAGRDLYAFTRKTHVTLARSHGVHPDAVNAQVGHSDGSVEEKYFLDDSQWNPSASSRMVYSLVCPFRKAEGEGKVLRLAAGAESWNLEAVSAVSGENRHEGQPEARQAFSQATCAASTSRKATSAIRTRDLRFTKPLLYR